MGRFTANDKKMVRDCLKERPPNLAELKTRLMPKLPLAKLPYRKHILTPLLALMTEGTIDSEDAFNLIESITISSKCLDALRSKHPPFFKRLFFLKINAGQLAPSIINELLCKISLTQPAMFAELIKEPTTAAETAFFKQIYNQALKNKDFSLLKTLKHTDPTQFAIISALDKKQLDEIANCKNPVLAATHMKAFVNGFGNISYQDGLIALAAIRYKKSYPFDPVLVKNHMEWCQLLNYIKLNIRLFKGQQLNVLFSGSHWQSGSLFIDDENQTNFLLIDSLGVECGETSGDFDAIKDYCEILEASSEVPGKTAYVSATRRQNSIKGCSVFSLNTLRHLFTLDSYLPVATTSRFPLLDYVQKHPVEVELKRGQSVALPLQLMRTAQTSKYIKDIVTKLGPVEELACKILPATSTIQEAFWRTNKGKKNIYGSFFSDFRHDPALDKVRNFRLERKLEGLSQNVWHYISERAKSDITTELQQFTVDGFIKRMQISTRPVGTPTLTNTDMTNVVSIHAAVGAMVKANETAPRGILKQPSPKERIPGFLLGALVCAAGAAIIAASVASLVHSGGTLALGIKFGMDTLIAGIGLLVGGGAAITATHMKMKTDTPQYAESRSMITRPKS